MFSLTHLSVSNYKLLKSASLAFTNGLTVLSGTTGAGKSMFIGALSLLMGAKSSKGLFELTGEKVSLWAEFSGDDPAIETILHENSIEFEGAIIIRRDIAASGQNRCFINDTPVTVRFLATLGERLIDFHGQHEDQAVLKPAVQLEILDRFANHPHLLDAYTSTYKSLQAATTELHALRAAEQERDDRLQLIRFKLDEIQSLDPQSGELAELESKVLRLQNSSKIQEHLQDISLTINEGDATIAAKLSSVTHKLSELANLDTTFNPLLEQSEEISNLLNDLSYSISIERGESSFDETDFNAMQERLFSLKALEKKFARSFEEVIIYREELHDELKTMQHIGTALETLATQIQQYEKELRTHAKALSASRKKAAKKIEKEISSELLDLSLADATFEVRIESKIGTHDILSTTKGISLGFDAIIFAAQLNKGIPFAPIKDIASGGETARIMLALKKVIAHRDAIGTLIFDEIDSDTGGRLGSIIGEKMRQISTSHQVLAITHLPQVAAYGAQHLKVEKGGTAKSTVTGIRQLSTEERLEELAHMMTGDKVTQLAREHARTLLEETGQLKAS